MAELAAGCLAACRAGATYRLQLTARLRLRRGRRAGRLPGRARRHARLPVADPAGRARLDARLRRGRPLAGSRADLGGEQAFRDDGRRAPPARPGRRRGHRAQPHGACRCRSRSTRALVGALPTGRSRRTRTGSTSTGPRRTASCCCRSWPGRWRVPGRPRSSTRAPRNPENAGGRRAGAALLRPRAPAPARARRTCRSRSCWRAALPAGLLAGRGHRAELPAVLRHRHAHRGPGRGPGGVRRHPRGAAAAGARGDDRRPADRPSRTGWPTRAATCAGWPRPPAPGSWWRRSWRAARRCRRLAVRRHHRLRRARPDRRRCSPTRPGTAAGRRVRPLHRRHSRASPRCEREAKREIADGTLRRRGRPAGRAARRAGDPALRRHHRRRPATTCWSSCWPRSRSTGPTSSPGEPPSAPPGGGDRGRRARPGPPGRAPARRAGRGGDGCSLGPGDRATRTSGPRGTS